MRAARGWVGTRFAHQGRLKKTERHRGGVDCLGLLVGVADELQLRDAHGVLLSAFDEQDYSHLPDTVRLECILLRLMQPIAVCDIRQGDVAMLRVDDRPQHLAIVSDGPGLIHAYAPARGVVEHALDAWWRARLHAGFRITSFL